MQPFNVLATFLCYTVAEDTAVEITYFVFQGECSDVNNIVGGRVEYKKLGGDQDCHCWVVISGAFACPVSHNSV